MYQKGKYMPYLAKQWINKAISYPIEDIIVLISELSPRQVRKVLPKYSYNLISQQNTFIRFFAVISISFLTIKDI
jgi:hypothetical protein